MRSPSRPTRSASGLLLALALAAPSGGTAQQTAHPERQEAVVIQPWEGERIEFCDTPELAVVLKVDSLNTGARRYSMGTGELAPRSSNAGRHAAEDEVIFFHRGRGWAVLGTDTVPVHTGTTLYVPRGVRHAFINPADEVMEFVWVVAPRGFEDRIREGGVPAGTPCPAPPRE